MSLRRFDPTDGRAARFHRLGPTCRLSIDRSQCFSCAVGRPGVERGTLWSVPSIKQRRASTAAKWSGARQRTSARWVGRSRIGRFGFWVSRAPVYGRPASAFVFSAASASCLGLSPLSGLTGAAAEDQRARTDGCDCPIAFHRSPGHGSPATASAHGFGVRRFRPGDESVSNTELVVCRGVACSCRPFALARRDASRPIFR